MWEASERELQLLNSFYQLRDDIADLEFERLETEGEILRIIEMKKDEKGKMAVFGIVSFILSLLVLAYFGLSQNYYQLAAAMVFATGLGACTIASVCILIFMVIRSLMRHSAANFWVKCADKLHVENDSGLKVRMQIRLDAINQRSEKLNERFAECERLLQEERAQKSNP